MPRPHGAKGNGAFSSLRFVPCRVEPGMFRTEWLVLLEAVDPRDPEKSVTVQLFADHRDVAGIRGNPKRNDPKPGWLRVEVGEKTKGLTRITLPQPAAPLGETVLVREDQVKHEART